MDLSQLKIVVDESNKTMGMIHPSHKDVPIGNLKSQLAFWVNNDGLPYLSKHGGPTGGGLVRVIEERGGMMVCAWSTPTLQIVTAEVPTELVDIETNARVIENALKYPSSYGLGS